ncbi:MAG: hypothetical protein ACOZQL_24110 [Myxococcota bacterium]
MPSRLFRWCAVVVALSSLVATATVIAYETLDEMARRVPLIVRGKVVRSAAGWDERERRIFTYTELIVSDTIKGKAGDVVLVKQPGGVLGEVGQSVAGAAQFTDGEDCVLLLWPAGDERGAFLVYGMSAGKISLTELHGKPAAMRSTDGIAFAVPAGRRVQPVSSPEYLGTPESLVNQLRAAVKGGAK